MKSEVLRPLSLPRNFSWVATGSAVDVLCQWGQIVLLAQVGSLEMVGRLVLAFAICAPVNALAMLNLRTALVTDAKYEYRFGEYLALRLLTAVLALLVIATIAIASGCQTETALIILVVGLGGLLVSISDLFHGLLQQRERMDRIAFALMIRGPLALALLALGVCLTGSLLCGALAFPVAAAVTLLALDLPNGWRVVKTPPPGHRGILRNVTAPGDELKLRWDARTMLRLAWLTLPLGIALMLVTLATSIPRYMVKHYLGYHALGVFASIVYLVMVEVKVTYVICQAVSPRLARHFAGKETGPYCRLLGKVLGLTALMGAVTLTGIAWQGGYILRLIYGADFTPYLEPAVYVMAAGAIMCLGVLLGLAIETMRRFGTHMIIRALSVAVLLALAPGCIRAYGLKGAALAMLIAYAFTALMCASVVFLAIRRLRQDKPLDLEADAPSLRAA